MTEDSFTLIAEPRKSPLRFFLLVFALSLPFWLAGALTSFQLLPGIPVSGFAVLCPVTAAAILVYRENKSAGVKKLLSRAFDFERVKAKIWYVPIILLMPCIMVLSYGAIRLMGLPVPAPPFSVGTILALFVGLFIGTLGEELGWSGYAIDPLQERFGAALFHTMIDLTWQVFPIKGSYYDPRVTGLITAIVALVVVIVWVPRTLARYSHVSMKRRA